ncbi:predicted protein [Scheffersomyces stipitis CBS 6054]|uniref:C2H2-type domain-containing protein n=1 Tax=Scheffersomyces stipitis (strain ATCC 58785 / CBS 6054 / NBRC 10063 / NRRL Y-11545) TaxID=322104 RepID=A3LU77_PICST|nr:predicted protein [Scheffersomyces stipitis CBS 6054]ABN66195.2 predicted protein [Scheffersomyces stipitis CBS 6054]KAG2733286.1 hypothetical protein G9P44_004276 [Scheffersomyces stipitis]
MSRVRQRGILTEPIRPSVRRLTLRENLSFNVVPNASEWNEYKNEYIARISIPSPKNKENEPVRPQKRIRKKKNFSPPPSQDNEEEKNKRRSNRSRMAPKVFEDLTNLPEEKPAVIAYNNSNTPKYWGMFYNVQVGDKIRRQCKFCPLRYNDLKGFNRHYQNFHLGGKGDSNRTESTGKVAASET